MMEWRNVGMLEQYFYFNILEKKSYNTNSKWKKVIYFF